ncbi:uncharacterized protein YktA (UPF0223 family) [Weissella uvarum]|uniref:UPF0223 family protein n=1 Tax=Weissella uvarum TaxID=1479233 RepID=UPI0019609DC9|nr:UPF0223 family protein [Weissella uvarum]MBM7617526.1 uncharacterized protein YktA (UPF0223 family) [Weissella uvarum]MCM0595590.1 UPF0223 family protein [Weissella uvarum]
MADKNFTLPFLDGWSTQDIVAVSRLYDAVATAYETGIERQDLLDAYRGFKEVVPSKAEEKQLDRSFQAESGYSIYQTMKQAQSSQSARVKMPD